MPMLPVVRDAPEVAIQILIYTVMTVAISLVLWPVAIWGGSTSSSQWCQARYSSSRRPSCCAVPMLACVMPYSNRWVYSIGRILICHCSFLAIAVDPLIHL
ncbi:heme O synthase [Cutibacterium acnes JCM 18918]|nr:heme O synthase [Cutibacterium acnes JCM 18918]